MAWDILKTSQRMEDIKTTLDTWISCVRWDTKLMNLLLVLVCCNNINRETKITLSSYTNKGYDMLHELMDTTAHNKQRSIRNKQKN